MRETEHGEMVEIKAHEEKRVTENNIKEPAILNVFKPLNFENNSELSTRGVRAHRDFMVPPNPGGSARREARELLK